MIKGFLDSNGNNALTIVPSGSGNVGRSSFDGVWFASSANGSNVNIAPSGTATVDGISFSNCESYLGFTNGFAITQAAGTSVKNISIIGGRISGAGSSGININGLNSGIISNVVIGSSGFFNPNPIGITLAGAIQHININSNDLTGSTTKISNSMTSSFSRIESNIGYNPVGKIRNAHEISNLRVERALRSAGTRLRKQQHLLDKIAGQVRGIRNAYSIVALDSIRGHLRELRIRDRIGSDRGRDRSRSGGHISSERRHTCRWN
jgi:hypothetical protein